jgi:protein SCO1/2
MMAGLLRIGRRNVMPENIRMNMVVAALLLAAATPVRAASPGNDAQRFPNVPLRTHDGASVRFYDDLIKGKVVVINFMFTTCTSICPRTTANLVKVEDILGERLGRDVWIVSVSVDPATDTSDVLRKYAARHGTKPGWQFVTGKRRDIDLIRQKLGVYDKDGDKTQHTGVLIYGNEATGQWAATPALADPATIARSVMRLVRPTQHPATR